MHTTTPTRRRQFLQATALGAAALATVTGIVAAAVPARRASGLDPVEAIRHV